MDREKLAKDMLKTATELLKDFKNKTASNLDLSEGFADKALDIKQLMIRGFLKFHRKGELGIASQGFQKAVKEFPKLKKEIKTSDDKMMFAKLDNAMDTAVVDFGNLFDIIDEYEDEVKDTAGDWKKVKDSIKNDDYAKEWPDSLDSIQKDIDNFMKKEVKNLSNKISGFNINEILKASQDLSDWENERIGQSMGNISLENSEENSSKWIPMEYYLNASRKLSKSKQSLTRGLNMGSKDLKKSTIELNKLFEEIFSSY